MNINDWTDRRTFLKTAVLGAALPASLAAGSNPTGDPPVLAAESAMNSIEFETELFRLREQHYRRRRVDPIQEGFRPVGGKLADFAIVRHAGRYHIFAIERRLREGTPFYPGHETFFCHASTENFGDWEVHDPVLWVRPGTWEGAHVWAPSILPRNGEFVMAYTGVNRVCSQNIGLAWSNDLFDWRRDPANPITPTRGCDWAFWRADGPSSCRDPNLLLHEGRVYMTYTVNTKEGASCIALTSTTDFRHWRDHGPILVGPAHGYECRLEGGHPQGQLESANLVFRHGRWLLLVKEARRGSRIRNWIYASDRPGPFDYRSGREFWPGGSAVEIVKEKGSRALLACMGTIRLGEVNWADERPQARFLKTRAELDEWLG